MSTSLVVVLGALAALGLLLPLGGEAVEPCCPEGCEPGCCEACPEECTPGCCEECPPECCTPADKRDGET